MRTRMVPFQRHVQRLAASCARRPPRPASAPSSSSRRSGELDRQVLERMLPPFEHMLRNAVVHGIEDPRSAWAAASLTPTHSPRAAS